MMRTSLLCLLVGLLVAACGEKDPKPKAEPVKNQPDEPVVKKPEPKAPVTGIGMVQDNHDDLVKEIEKQEAKVKAGGKIDEGLARAQLRLADNLIKVCQLAIKHESRQIVQRRYAEMRVQFGKMHARMGEVGEELQEVRGILQRARLGTDRIPEGFTEAELSDRLGDLEEEVRTQQKAIDEYKPKMKELEDLLASEGDIPPPPEGTVFTRELDELKKTRARVKTLLG